MPTEDIYKELCASYRAIDEFRTKLLGILPLASGGIFAFLIDPKHFVNCEMPTNTTLLLPLVGVLGSLVTLGLFAFEIYGIRKCTALIMVGKFLEDELQCKHGQFIDRPEGVLRIINEPLAAAIIYPAVLASWTYLTLFLFGQAIAQIFAIGVFATFLLATLWLIYWLKSFEIPDLERKLGLDKRRT